MTGAVGESAAPGPNLVIAAPEAVVVGLAAAVWACGMEPRAATVDDSAEFLDEYQRAAGRAWPADEIEASWTAGP
jgi:hypothetical protein